MSPRAALWLETFGFQEVYDYVAGKADWLAHNRPAEGTRATSNTIGSLARQDVATCRLGESTAEVGQRVETSPYGFGLVLDDAQVVLGRVRKSALHGLAGSIDEVLEPGPS